MHSNSQVKLLLFIQFFMQAALWIVMIELPIYLSQDDASGSLLWSHTQKGFIFFTWVFIQNITNIIFGAYADKFGVKKSLYLSQSLLVIGYLSISFASEYYLFLISVSILGVGFGIFKPSLEGCLSFYSKNNNSHKIWSSFLLFINIAVISSTILIVYLEKISYQAAFIGSAIIILFNFPLIYFLKERMQFGDVIIQPSIITSFKTAFADKRMIYLVLIMSGFTIMYINFYQMLPNYIYDWVDTSDLVAFLSLPQFMTTTTESGVMLSYQMIYFINPFLVIIFIKLISNYTHKYHNITALTIGLILVCVGCFLVGLTQLSIILLLAIIIYTSGEMIVRPKFQEIISEMSPVNKESQYISFLHISYAVGYMSGSLSGGMIYDKFGEKAHLAQKALQAEFGVNVESKTAMLELSQKLGMTFSETTTYLFNNYNPFYSWLPFIFILSISIISLVFYNKKYA